VSRLLRVLQLINFSKCTTVFTINRTNWADFWEFYQQPAVRGGWHSPRYLAILIWIYIYILNQSWCEYMYVWLIIICNPSIHDTLSYVLSYDIRRGTSQSWYEYIYIYTQSILMWTYVCIINHSMQSCFEYVYTTLIICVILLWMYAHNTSLYVLPFYECIRPTLRIK